LVLTGSLLVVGLAHEGGDIGFDDAAATGKETEGDEESGLVFDAEDEVAEDVGDREADDGPVFSEEAVGEKSSEEREEIAGHLEGVESGAGPRFVEVERGGEIEGENGAHAVVGGAFGEFTPEEVVEPDGVPCWGVGFGRFGCWAGGRHA